MLCTELVLAQFSVYDVYEQVCVAALDCNEPALFKVAFWLENWDVFYLFIYFVIIIII